jgi:glucose-1-phosphate thymidylyltransferase
MEIAKALVLVGRGCEDRPWPTAPVVPKHLFPIANRPILFHNLEALRAAGVLEAAILSEPSTSTAIEQAVGDGRDWGLNVTHVQWSADADGTLGNALASGYDFLEDEPVLVQQGDALLRERMHRHIAAFAHERLDALALRLTAGHAPAQLTRAPGPGYLLSPRAVSILLEDSAPSANPVAGVRARGGRVRVQQVAGCLPCHGDQESLLESNRHVLERLEAEYSPESLEDTRVQGPVVIHPTARVSRSLLRGPAIIGPDVTITDSYVGPYTSLGTGVVMEAAEIEHSIVLPDAQLRFVGTRLESSIIGRGARIARAFDPPAAMKMTVGDGAEVILK